MIVSLVHHRFTADEYAQMVRAGILTKDDRVELIEGEIIEMSPIGPKHAACVRRLQSLLTAAVGKRALVSIQSPVRLDDRSQPEPDVALLRPRDDCYSSAHPVPADVLLVVEVADTTQEMDRDVKLPLYARAGIVEAWLVDLKGGHVAVCRQPGPDGYGDVRRAARGERVAPAAFPDADVPVDQLLA